MCTKMRPGRRRVIHMRPQSTFFFGFLHPVSSRLPSFCSCLWFWTSENLHIRDKEEEVRDYLKVSLRLALTALEACVYHMLPSRRYLVLFLSFGSLWIKPLLGLIRFYVCNFLIQVRTSVGPDPVFVVLYFRGRVCIFLFRIRPLLGLIRYFVVLQHR